MKHSEKEVMCTKAKATQLKPQKQGTGNKD